MYLYPTSISYPVNPPAILRKGLLLLILTLYSFFALSQELTFKNPILESGVDGADGAVYRFMKVNSKVDALVTISARSSSQVKLQDIDKKAAGLDKAFQPQVMFNDNNTPAGNIDWWMEFNITFVNSGLNSPAAVDSFRVTGLDIDGNSDKINEWVSFYNNASFSYENTTLLNSSNIYETIGITNTVVGKKFDGPTKRYHNIDTAAKDVMVTTNYVGLNSFKFRAGGHSTKGNGATDGMYAFWFKSLNTSQEFSLPLVLTEFSATLNNKIVGLNWITGKEKSLNYFVVERSVNGVDYKEIGVVVASGGSNVKTTYNFSDEINNKATGIVYYRLKMVDFEGRSQRSQVRMIRVGEEKDNLRLDTYPNPVTSELRITLPVAWQNATVSFDLYTSNGLMVKHMVAGKSNQTEILNVNDLRTGVYIIKVSNGTETAVQRIVKSN